MQRVPLLILLVLLLQPIAAHAGEDGEGLVLNGAPVLGSPGVPKGLDAFLPGGKRPGKLAWPLPQGSFVVLGLPSHDPLARRVCDVFQLDVDDLGGGYAVWAWREGRHARVFVMAADPAALQAARFEFDTDAPAEMMAPDMRSLDFERPNEQAYVVVRSGTRRVLPRYRMRAWAPGDAVGAQDAMTAGGARSNRVWIETRGEPDRGRVRTVAALRAQGVTPVVALRIPGPLTDENAETLAAAGALDVRTWQRELGVRHAALVFERTTAVHELAIARRIADALRPGGLEELVVVPHAHSDRRAREAAPPDLSGIPEAVIAWSGPSEHSTHVTRADAARRAQQAGVPVVLLETWEAPDQAGSDPARIPALPRGRAADLPDVLDGIVVVGRGRTEAILDDAWASLPRDRMDLALLRTLAPVQDAGAPAAFADDLRKRLRAAHKETFGLKAWMAPMADALRDAVWERGGTPNAAAVPVVPERITADGRITERPWGFAHPLVKQGAAEVLVLSDGDALRFAVRIEKAAVGDTPFLCQLALEAPKRTNRWHVALTRTGARVDSSGREGMPTLEPGHVATTWHESKTHYTAEIAFDRFALGGEPHTGRLFDCGVSWGPKNLWPKGPSNGVMGTLLVTR